MTDTEAAVMVGQKCICYHCLSEAPFKLNKITANNLDVVVDSCT